MKRISLVKVLIASTLMLPVVYSACINAQENMYMGRRILTIDNDQGKTYYVDGLYAINFFEWVTNEQINEFLVKYNLERYRPVSPTGRWHVRGDIGQNMFSMRSIFRSLDIIEKAEIAYRPPPRTHSNQSQILSLNSIMMRTRTEDDQDFDMQWYLHNTAQWDSSTYDADIDAPEGWNIETGEELWVAVLDTGIPLSQQGVLLHPDLKNTDSSREIEIFAWAAFYEESPGHPLNDNVGHGTKVTGILAATHDNEGNIKGVVADNIHIVPVKIEGVYGYLCYAELASAIETTVYELYSENSSWPIILNCSWGISPDSSNVLLEAVEYADGYDAILICAAGNTPGPVQYPAYYAGTENNVIAVGSSTWNDELSDECATGPQITVVAPGSGTNSKYSKQQEDYRFMYTTISPNTWDWAEPGTSYATPQVSGLAALIYSVNPNLTIQSVRNIIISGCDTITGGYERISLYGSLVLLQPPSAPSNLSAQYSTTGPKVVVQWDRNSSSEGVTKYAIQRAAGAGEFSTISDNVPDPGSGTTVTYNDQDPPVPTAGYWRYRVMAYNNYGGWGDYCSPVSEDSPPTAPTDLSGEYVPPELGGPEVDLEWNRNPEGQDVDTYWLERAVEDGDFECIDARIADPGSGSIVYYTDDDLPTADYWRYRVRAKNSVAWGEFCAPIEVYATGIEKKDAYVTIQPLPTELTLDQNYPNPFNPTTAVRYGLPKLTRVYLRILNIRGQVVRTLVDDEKPAGWYTVTWDGKNESGQDVASGIYLYLIETDEGKILKKMTLLR